MRGVDAGVISGFTDNTYRPNSTISRQQANNILGSYLSKKEISQKGTITGATGFVGTALVERLLRSVPDCELVLLVRDGQRTSAARRTDREIFKNDAFDRLRAQCSEQGVDFILRKYIVSHFSDIPVR